MASSLLCINVSLRLSAKALLVGALVFLVLACVGQETFNKRYPLGGNGLLTQLEIVNEHYCLLGFMLPSNSLVYREDFVILNINSEGEIIEITILGADSEIHQPFSKTSDYHFESGNIFSAVVMTTLGINNMRCTIYSIDPSLNIEIIGEYTSPYFQPDDFNSAQAFPRDIKVAPDGTIYLTLAIFQPGTGNHFTVLKILPSGVVDWEYVYATNSTMDMCYSLVAEIDGVVFGAVSEAVDFPSANRRLIKLSAETGLEMWNYSINSDTVGVLFDMLKINGQFIAGTSTLQGVGGVPMIFGLNNLAELQWSNLPVVSLVHQTAQSADLLDLTTDGNIVVGANHLVPDEVLGGWQREEAWIIKLTPQGEQVWERKFYFDEGECLINKIYDMKATPDGGVVFCGESRVCTTPNGPDQQGWVVKLDSCGCLVPGCDPDCIYDGVAEQSHAKGALMVVGPNPASGSEFYVHIRASSEQRLANSWLRIHDLQGREVKNIRLRGEGTYAVSCSGWAAGVYVCALIGEDGGVLETVKVVME